VGRLILVDDPSKALLVAIEKCRDSSIRERLLGLLQLLTVHFEPLVVAVDEVFAEVRDGRVFLNEFRVGNVEVAFEVVSEVFLLAGGQTTLTPLTTSRRVLIDC